MDITDLRTQVESAPASDAEREPEPEEIPLASNPHDIRTELLEDVGDIPSWYEAVRWARGQVTGSIRTDNSILARFSAASRKQRQAKLFDWDRTTRAQLEAPYDALLTFTADPTVDDSYLPVLDCHEDLVASRSRRQKRLRRVLGDREWAWIRILGAYKRADRRGYPHSHQLVRVDGPIQPIQFEPVVKAHIAESPVARQTEMSSGAVVVEPVTKANMSRPEDYTERAPTTKGVNYLAGHAIDLDPSTDTSHHEELLASALLAGECEVSRVRYP